MKKTKLLSVVCAVILSANSASGHAGAIGLQVVRILGAFYLVKVGQGALEASDNKVAKECSNFINNSGNDACKWGKEKVQECKERWGKSKVKKRWDGSEAQKFCINFKNKYKKPEPIQESSEKIEEN